VTALTVVPILVLPMLLVLQKLEHWAIDMPATNEGRQQPADAVSRPLPDRKPRQTR
jgi:hypothetical protein